MTMMKCGHAANAKTEDGQPVCVICYGIVEGALEVAPEPDLTGRVARCRYRGGHNPVPSNTRLAFFSHLPDMPHDEYYCGCYGWD